MYKILVERVFTENKDSPFKKIEVQYSVGHKI